MSEQPLPVSASAETVSFKVPNFTGRGVRLLAVQKQHYPFLWELRADPELAYLWMQGRDIPSFEAYSQELDYALATHVISLMVVETLNDPREIGIIYAYDYNQLDGYAYVSMAFHPAYMRTAWAMEAYYLYQDYIFSFFSIRKMYAEAYEFNQLVLGILRKSGWEVEGVFKQQRYFSGRYWTTIRLALSQQGWLNIYNRYANYVHPRPDKMNQNHNNLLNRQPTGEANIERN